jgi:hypothetical protein
MTNILVKDDAATPNELTFVPVTDTPIPFWRSNMAGVPLEGQARLSAYIEKTKSQDYKISVKLEVPVMETLGASGTSAGYVAPQKVAFTESAILTTFVNKRGTTASRANLDRLMLGIIQGASSTTGTGTFSNAAAGSAFAALTAPFPTLLRDLVLPN